MALAQIKSLLSWKNIKAKVYKLHLNAYEVFKVNKGNWTAQNNN